ncbi:MAG: hypothetical protein JXP73_20590 [Deltaproteobacteria bacterium]|nr:hypothetical protein [Deltaproteobacteria bacterium]
MSLAKLALVFLAAHAATAVFYLLDRAPGTAAALLGLPLDDAWIHLVYARSLAALQGFAYNPGQLETGSTSPLWAALLVPATWVARAFGISVVLPVKVTGILAGVGASVAAARVARHLGLGLAIELAAGLAIAVDPALAFAQVSGMEVMLASGIALWALADFLADRLQTSALSAGLAPLARPELVLLTLPLLALVEWRLHRRRSPWSLRLAALAPVCLSVGGWVLYCWLVSGHPLPSTFYAKFSSRADYFSHNVAALLGQVLPAWPWFAYGAGFVLWAVGAVVLFRRGGWLVASFPVAYLLAVAGSQYFSQPLPFYWQRYWLPALPAVLLGVAVGSVQVLVWAWQRRRQAWGPVYGIAAAVLVMGSLARLPSALRRSADLYAWNCQNIEELNVEMAKWLREHTASGEVIAVSDAGAARYFADRPIFDILGLNNHRYLHRERRSAPDLGAIRLVSAFPAFVPSLRDSPAWRPVHRVATEHLTICDCPQSEIVAYRRTDAAE